MRIIWLCNIAPAAIRRITGGKDLGALWLDHTLEDMMRQEHMLHVLYADSKFAQGDLNTKCSYQSFSEGLPYQYSEELEQTFGDVFCKYVPDVIHIWGTEYGHTLAAVKAAKNTGYLDRVVISIQGLCSVYARHYAEGVPEYVQRQNTFRDFVRFDNIRRQQKKYALRGELEEQALSLVRHVIGRTDWDEACTKRLNPNVQYHFCNETLRKEFYEGQWNYQQCTKHRIFASSSAYPVKGFHYLLEAFAEVLQAYPDATLAVTGPDPLNLDFQKKLRQGRYAKYLAQLIRKYHIEDKVLFQGMLDVEKMKRNYLQANVFAMPSTIENSPNSLGEAMLLGVPCVSGDIGGVTNLMEHGKEGFVYQSTAPYMLAYYIKKIFAMEDAACAYGEAAKKHAQHTHDPDLNIDTLVSIYAKIAQK